MKRRFAALIAGALMASVIFSGIGIASARPARPVSLNVGRMARNYTTVAMMNYTHMSGAYLATTRGNGCSYWSIAASSGVDATRVVGYACGRAQGVVDGFVRRHMVTRTSARAFMAKFIAYCRWYLGTAPGLPAGSIPTTTTPGSVPTFCPGPWTGGVPPTSTVGILPTLPPDPGTPGVPTTGTAGPGGIGCPGPWAGVVPTATPDVTPTPAPAPVPGWGPGGCW